MGFGVRSANILTQVLKVGGNVSDWTHIDLSLNKLGLNLGPVLSGLKQNSKLVSLRLSNNDLGGSSQV